MHTDGNGFKGAIFGTDQVMLSMLVARKNENIQYSIVQTCCQQGEEEKEGKKIPNKPLNSS